MFDGRRVRVGIAPIGWTNDDLPSLGGDTPGEQVMSEAALAGYVGCGVGHKFPRDPAALKRALALRGLEVCGVWTSLQFTRNAMREQTIRSFSDQMNYMKAVGATDLVCAELGHAVHQQPIDVLPNKPVFNDEQWKAMIAGLHEVGRIARRAGMSVSYHPHVGTGVQTLPEIDRLMADTDPDLVGLLYDPGHLHYGGADPIEVGRRHGRRITHVHLKDVRQEVLDRAKREGMSFLESVIAGVFTVPGDGNLDYVEIMRVLDKSGFEGWLEVEAEQDPAKADPLEYAIKARTFLREVAGV
jgi:inosose dehydratase